jgi:Uma2 family endonuclease
MENKPHRPVLYPDSPTFEQWAGMTGEERRRYYASIPQDPPPFEVHPPEGLGHDLPTRRGMEALEQYFRKRGRHIFLASDLHVIYPNESSFAPDLIAVLDVQKEPDEELPAWVVAAEGRGIDVALEVHVSGNRNKDAVENVERYARLGIREYFLFDRPRERLFGWRLPSENATTYQHILPQEGALHCEVLDLDLRLVNGRLRFFSGTGELPAAGELIARLDKLVAALEDRLAVQAQAFEEAATKLLLVEKQLEEERKRNEEERKQHEEERKQNEELRAEIERLRRGGAFS